MNTPKKANLPDWDDRETFTVGEATALWGGSEPRAGHWVYPSQRALKRRLQEVLVILGFKTKESSPPPEPRYWERFSRDVWIQVAERMGERPPFLYHDARPRRKKAGRPDDEKRIVGAYKSLVNSKNIDFSQPKARAYEKVRHVLNPAPSIKTVEKYIGPLFDKGPAAFL